jgi:hypothetical protein
LHIFNCFHIHVIFINSEYASPFACSFLICRITHYCKDLRGHYVCKDGGGGCCGGGGGGGSDGGCGGGGGGGGSDGGFGGGDGYGGFGGGNCRFGIVSSNKSVAVRVYSGLFARFVVTSHVARDVSKDIQFKKKLLTDAVYFFAVVFSFVTVDTAAYGQLRLLKCHQSAKY